MGYSGVKKISRYWIFDGSPDLNLVAVRWGGTLVALREDPVIYPPLNVAADLLG